MLMSVNAEGLLEILDQYDKKHVEAHQRLRTDFRDLDERVADSLRLLNEKQNATNTKLTELVSTPLDVTKVVLSPKIVGTIIGILVVFLGGLWGTNSGLRSDVRDILTRMAVEQRVSDANAKLLETNNAVVSRAIESNTREMKDSLATISKRQDLLTLQYNQLNDQITRLTAQRVK